MRHVMHNHSSFVAFIQHMTTRRPKNPAIYENVTEMMSIAFIVKYTCTLTAFVHRSIKCENFIRSFQNVICPPNAMIVTSSKLGGFWWFYHRKKLRNLFGKQMIWVAVGKIRKKICSENIQNRINWIKIPSWMNNTEIQRKRAAFAAMSLQSHKEV